MFQDVVRSSLTGEQQTWRPGRRRRGAAL